MQQQRSQQAPEKQSQNNHLFILSYKKNKSHWNDAMAFVITISKAYAMVPRIRYSQSLRGDRQL